jgi:hypothetical protein
MPDVMRVEDISSLFCKKGDNPLNIDFIAEAKTDFQEAFPFIANALFQLSKLLYHFHSLNSSFEIKRRVS